MAVFDLKIIRNPPRREQLRKGPPGPMEAAQLFRRCVLAREKRDIEGTEKRTGRRSLSSLGRSWEISAKVVTRCTERFNTDPGYDPAGFLECEKVRYRKLGARLIEFGLAEDSLMQKMVAISAGRE